MSFTRTRSGKRASPVRCAIVAIACAAALQAPAAAEPGAGRQTVRAATYQALTSIHEAMEAGDYEAAMQKITSLEPRVRRVAYERAVLDQTRAYVLLEQQRYIEAADAIVAALAPDLLSPTDTANLHSNLAQIYLSTERPEEAARTLEALFANERIEPSSHGLALAGHAYYLLERYAKARKALEQAVALEESPRAQWLQLLVATCYEQRAFDRALDVLRDLVARFPDERRYWVELSAISLYLEDGPLALASLELAEDAGLLEPADLVRLVRLNLHLEAPARAARLLTAALDAGRVEPDIDNLELLADAWVMAREYERAIEALQRAVSASPERALALALRRGELLAHLERWDEAITSLDRAAKSEDAGIAAQAHLLTGIAAYYRGDYARSIVALGRAERHERTRGQAKQWARQTLSRIE